MAAICLDQNMILTLNNCYMEQVLPPVENWLGDLFFTPNSIELVKHKTTSATIDIEMAFKSLTTLFFMAISIGVLLYGGGFMFYVPLYIVSAPIFYWALKISYAFFIAKFYEKSVHDFYSLQTSTPCEKYVRKHPIASLSVSKNDSQQES